MACMAIFSHIAHISQWYDSLWKYLLYLSITVKRHNMPGFFTVFFLSRGCIFKGVPFFWQTRMGWLWLLLFNKIYQSTILLRLYKLYKFLARLTTSTTEIYRICYAASIQLGWQTGLESALDEKVDNNNLTTPLLETPVPAHIIYRIGKEPWARARTACWAYCLTTSIPLFFIFCRPLHPLLETTIGNLKLNSGNLDKRSLKANKNLGWT